MKITPLEIRQKDFEKKLRGYDKDEVNAFLQSLSNEWERVLEENKDLTLKLQHSEKEVMKLREVETSLFKTLKTAEDTGANVIEQANKAAELHMKEAKMNAEALLNESKNKARSMIEQSEMESRQIIEDLQDAVKNIEQNYRDLENQRQIALQELKNLSITLIEKVEKDTKETKEFRFDDYVQRVKKQARESEERIKVEKKQVTPEEKKSEAPVVEKKVEEVKVEKSQPKEVVKDPPKTEELKERIIGRKERTVTKIKRDEVSAPSVKKENKPEPEETSVPRATPKKSIPKEAVAKAPEEIQEERKGPRIAKTVSFFDELDAE